MSSIKKDYERLEKLVEAGGKWERSFGKKTFRKFTPMELERMKENMRMMLTAHTPNMYQLTKEVTCPSPCNHVFYKVKDWIPQGVRLLKCPKCGERHNLVMRPKKSAIRNPKSHHEPIHLL